MGAAKSKQPQRLGRLLADIIVRLLQWPKALLAVAAEKINARRQSERLAEGARPPRLRPEAVRELFAQREAGARRSAGDGRLRRSADSRPAGGAFAAGGAWEAADTAGDAPRERKTVRAATAGEGAAVETEAHSGDKEATGGNAAADIVSKRGSMETGMKPPADPAAGIRREAVRSPELGVVHSEFGARLMRYSGEERSLLYRVEYETEQANRNNVTRTEAYRAVYFRRPELHWALLAHVVSRNGGWNMTDLRGELLPRLLPEERLASTFRLLERCNALIFGDAYPQLLLYEAGRKAGRDYSPLARAFGVTAFMLPVWAQFWKRQDSALLTTALIVNEQHVIERRVVRHPEYKRHVIDKLAFKMQASMQTNTVVLPYGAPTEEGMKLAGLVLEDFGDLTERIEFGKRLYAVLFGVPEVNAGVLKFVRAVHHSGSRADYAPHMFTKWRGESGADKPKYAARLNGCRLVRGGKPLYSPELCEAWPDLPVVPPEPDDWTSWAEPVERYFDGLPLPPVFEATDEHCLAINKIELAVIGAQRLGLSE